MMKKCENSRDELKEVFLDNIGIAYDLIKDDFMKKSPEELWEECFSITFTRSLYMFLVYKAENATKDELKYMQKRNIFTALTDSYYDGEYKNDYTGYEEMVKDYIKKQKKMEQTGDMQ